MLCILRDTSIYKIPSLEQGDRSALTADLSRAAVVPHCAGLTGSVPLAQLVPIWCVLSLQDSSLLLHALEAASTPTRCPPPTSKGFRASPVAVFPPRLPRSSEEIFCLPYSYGQGSRGGKDSRKKRLAYSDLFWEVGSQEWQQRSCPAPTLVSRRFLSSISTELCRARAAAGGWDWVPQEGRKAGKCPLTSQETGKVFKKFKWMSVPPEISQKTYHAAF